MHTSKHTHTTLFQTLSIKKKKKKIQTGVIACYLGEKKPLVPLFSLISSPLVFTSHSSVLLSVRATLDRSMHELEHMCLWVGVWAVLSLSSKEVICRKSLDYNAHFKSSLRIPRTLTPACTRGPNQQANSCFARH